MKIIVTGGRGQVGCDIALLAKQLNAFEILTPSHRECDISDRESLQSFVDRHCPDLIINAAAYTKVDQAEIEKAQAFNANALGAKHVAQICQHVNIPLLHFSTDFVFDGNTRQTYHESDKPNPLNYYGKTKYQGEQTIQSIMTPYFIVRLAGVFGRYGNNFIKAILKAAKTKSTLRVVSDQYVTPTGTKVIAQMSLQLCEHITQNDYNHIPWGIYHYSSQGVLTWYEFACYCIDKAKAYTDLAVNDIIPVTTQEYHANAKRPLYPILNCDKIKSQLSIEQPTWQIEANELIKSILTHENPI